MGSSASLTSIDAEECKRIAGELYDDKIFNQLKCPNGFVTLEQLKQIQAKFQVEQLKEYQADDKSLEYLDSTEKKQKSWSTQQEAELLSKRKDFDVLVDATTHLVETLSTTSSDSKEAAILKKKIDHNKSREVFLQQEIRDIEAKAWEPIVKGSTVLFYYNW